ncbi:hypothetical protein ADT27_05605 [Xanthomonas oryzae]|uniref:hypothetical protein n=1 Tax=Xanthomonas oryzae TaxID=347 RepID=UPI0006C128F0|nr:hypothetical protein [Xanthomonas oryzae]KOR48923.1 hypothetical protein ADT27_05605 [Xanthomonas oryzae]OWB32419.1 hypothetical protein XocBAI20_03745 [Xanthomonas oryzae pv. oryzicola]QEO98895.1 hypothetical protein XOCgx_3907 [Xanthomonas oryzae pv. oryzicola]
MSFQAESEREIAWPGCGAGAASAASSKRLEHPAGLADAAGDMAAKAKESRKLCLPESGRVTYTVLMNGGRHRARSALITER